MKQFLVVSEFVYSSQNSTGYFWSKIIERVSSDFEQIKVLTPEVSTLSSEKIRQENVEYVEFARPYFNKKSLLSRVCGQLRLTSSFFRALVGRAKKGDVVFSGTNPAILLMLMPFIKKVVGFKWCLLVHDVFPDNLVPAGIVSEQGVFFKLISRYFSFVYSSADHVFVIGRDMKELMAMKVSDERKVSVVPNWVSDDDVFPIDKADSEIINSLGWQDSVVFQFFGNIGKVQGVDNLLDAISMVSSSHAKFLFIGDGTESLKVKQFIERYDNGNVAYIGSLKQSEKSKGLCACDVALITLQKGMKGLGVPSKSYFSMAADRPLLAVMDEGSEIACMIQEESIGWYCAPSDPSVLANLIDDICCANLSEMSGRPRKILQEKYSEKVVLNELVSHVKHVMECDAK